MKRSEIIRRLSELLKKYDSEFDEANLTMDMNIRTNLNVDSIRIMEMIGDIEDMFGIEVPDRKLRELQTIEQIVDFIGEHT